jgi:colanic acid/amylovoran biosynthesis glycosyltransferase
VRAGAKLEGRVEMAKRPLVLLTVNHPFTFNGGETMFVAPELPFLSEAFANTGVTVVPLHDEGKRLDVPEGVLVDTRLARLWKRRRFLWYLIAVLWPGFVRELWRGLTSGGAIGAARVWRWAAIAQATWAWLRQSGLPDDALLYTYWRGGGSLAATRWCCARVGARAVTRVHRYELYDDAFKPPFQPWIGIYDRLARVIAISQHGADYLRARGVPFDRVKVFRLGVPATSVQSAFSRDGALRIVSCSTITEIKRVPLIAESIVRFAASNPDKPVEWHHFGDGPQRSAVDHVLQQRPPNLRVSLHGRVENRVVLSHYETHPVDLFVLLSSSEGLPVAVQEALAAGIPILATNAGGVAEAVGPGGENGELLPVDVTATEVCEAMRRLLVDSSVGQIESRRRRSFALWSGSFDTRRNHYLLAKSLQDMD